MIANTGFPEYIESIAIGPNRDFLKTNTSLCDIADDFEIELELAYKWKDVTTSYLVLPELRDYVKYLTINGPELDTESLIYFSDKINKVPLRYKNKVLDELEVAFNGGNKINPITQDKDFLSKLADLLKDCNSPCNYFRAYGDSIGTIFDISRNNNTSTEPSSVDDSRPPATHVGMNIFNKMHTAIRDSYAEMCARAGAVWDDIKSDKPSIVRSDTDAYTSITNIYSDTLSKIKRRTQDCFRLYDYNNRYNAYNSDMNLGAARDKYFDIALQVGNLEKTTKVYSINASGDINKQREPATTAANALSFKKLNAKYDDLIFNPNAITVKTTGMVGVSVKVPANEIHFTTYGKYDKIRGGGDTASNQELGGNVITPGREGEYKFDLSVPYYDSDGNRIALVALSDEAKNKYNFTKLGETFTISDANGTTQTFMYADRSPQGGVNIDVADYVNTTQAAAEAATPARYFKNSSDRNASEVTLTKTGFVENYAIRKYKK